MDSRRHLTRNVTQGALRGSVAAGVMTFRSVPYAAPPVGQNRFRPPEEAPGWTGVRPVLDPGPSAPQQANNLFTGIDLHPITGAGWRKGADFLTLNVWAPVEATRSPVMVWIHGGGNTLGTKDAAAYDGSNFARDGIVCVAMNYRLGVEGFVPLPDGATNLGLRDVIAALSWVHDNIEAFGGDPGNVTIFGESGGAILTACLVASPLTEGLFRRAIVQSGHGSAVYPLEIAQRSTRKLADRLGVSADVAGFRTVSPERAVSALARLSRPGAIDMRDDRGFDPSFRLSVLSAVYGDDVLPQHPLVALQSGAARGTSLLIGATSEEAKAWFGPPRLLALPHFIARWASRRMAPDGSALVDAYRAAMPGARGGEVLAATLTDAAFRWPARQFAAAFQGTAHVYEFDWRSPAAGGRLGAAHGLDLPFVFDRLSVTSGPRGITGVAPPQELADYVHRLWGRFATDGSLPWPPFDPTERLVHRLWSRQTAPDDPIPAAAFFPDPAHDGALEGS